MTAIDPAKAVDVMTRLESVIRGVDPEFTPSPKPAGLNTTLSGFAFTREHAAKAMAVGQNVDALLALTRRQLAEAAIKLKVIAASMPAGDSNAAGIASLVETLMS